MWSTAGSESDTEQKFKLSEIEQTSFLPLALRLWDCHLLQPFQMLLYLSMIMLEGLLNKQTTELLMVTERRAGLHFAEGGEE